ncbi:hypothetical protein QF032_007724 [Streptomyces achromogenes]|uniref:hypothetical protein n=1 Tax=Streptomyces achromogenes TaxID=67255 RepID=UPI00278169ED|nr:hypothetical protein [Streptomyces achromogenes]MDQ0835880.1 hypothetical protein [Streptomyces achromogenes]
MSQVLPAEGPSGENDAPAAACTSCWRARDTPGVLVPAALTDQLARFGLPARLPEEFHTVRGFAVDDRAPAVDAWCGEDVSKARCAGEQP